MYYLQPISVLAAVTMSKESVLALASARDNTEEDIGNMFVETAGAKGRVAEDSEESASSLPATAGSSKVPCKPHWPVLKMSAELSVETAGKVAEDSVESASNFPATAGSSKTLFDLYWPVPNVSVDLHVETTRAKGKVDEDSNFPATAGSSMDPFILHPQGDGAEESCQE